MSQVLFGRVFVLACLVATASCATEEARTQAGGRYLAASWVTSDDNTNTYIALFDSLDQQAPLDFGAALEVPGYGDAWVYDEWVFVVDGETPVVKRYVIRDGALSFEAEVSFTNEGVLGAAFWDNQILSREKAYLTNGQNREYVVWNPTTMEITGHVPWPTLDFGDRLEPFQSYTDRGGVVVDGHFFHGFYGHDEDFQAFGDHSIIAVYDIATDALVDTIHVPCPMMDVASLGDDGFIYVSGWSYIPLSYASGYSPNNCAARIDPQTRALDESWTLDLTDVADGGKGSALRAVSGNDGILAVFQGSGVEPHDGMDIWELDVGADDWELFAIDLSSRALTAC